MSRLSFALVILVGLLAGGFGVALLRPASPALTDADVRAVVADMLAADKLNTPAAPVVPAGLSEDNVRQIFNDMLATDKANAPVQSPQVAELDPDKVDKLIENYLMSDPTILSRMNDKLQEAQHVAARQAQKDAIDANYAQIYQQPDTIVLGNPKGDVTLVEMFDYNCSYCRGALPDMASLIADDPNLKVILKEFPILTAGSVDAAKVAVLVSEDPKINYWDFHEKLFSARGEVGADQALQVAESLGANRVELMLDMNARKPADVIQQSYDLAKALNVSGTPTYILGDEVIPGALPLEGLKAKIANLRACGSTECPVTDAAPAG